MESVKDVIINTDGGSRGNPGPSASGFVIKNLDDKILLEGGEYLGITTNNRAEYQAVKQALEKAEELKIENVDLYLDSELIAKQLTGVYRVKDQQLLLIYKDIKKSISSFKKFRVTHVRRAFNKEADAIVNNILDAQEQ